MSIMYKTPIYCKICGKEAMKGHGYCAPHYKQWRIEYGVNYRKERLLTVSVSPKIKNRIVRAAKNLGMSKSKIVDGLLRVASEEKTFLQVIGEVK